MKFNKKKINKFREQYMKRYGVLLSPEEAAVKVENLKIFLTVIEEARRSEGLKK